MRFRKLYWVTEQVTANNKSSVLGVFTSVPDLVCTGLRGDGSARRGEIRLSLFQLDSDLGPLRSWTPSNFASVCEDLKEFVQSEEFTQEECNTLAAALKALAPVVAAS